MFGWFGARRRSAALRQLSTHVLETGSGAAVENFVSDSDYHSAEDFRVDAVGQSDVVAGEVGERVRDLSALLVGERDGGDGEGGSQGFLSRMSAPLSIYMDI